MEETMYLKIPEHLVREDLAKLIEEKFTTDSNSRWAEIHDFVPAILSLLSSLDTYENRAFYSKVLRVNVREITYLSKGLWPVSVEDVSRAAQWILAHLPAGSLPDETIECFRKYHVPDQIAKTVCHNMDHQVLPIQQAHQER